MKDTMLWLVFLTLPLASCEISESERCGPNYVYENHVCLPTGPGTGLLGETCIADQDCGGDETDFCAKDLGAQEGICTFRNCTVNPDSCPEAYKCCNLPESINAQFPDFCIPKEAWDQQPMCNS